MQCPDDETELMGDLPGRWLCPAYGRGWRLDAAMELVADEEIERR
jgi:hypothetical protein